MSDSRKGRELTIADLSASFLAPDFASALIQAGDEPIVVVDLISKTPEPLGVLADGEAYVAIGGRV